MTNAQKTPVARTLPLFAAQVSVNELLKRGFPLPGHVVAIAGTIVTVAFDVTDLALPPPVQMPLAGPEYVRFPIQVNDKGIAVPSSLFLGAVSGLGTTSALATFQTPEFNLSNLWWIPLGNKNWSAVDPNAVTLYGPNGVVFRDTDSHTVGTLTPSGGFVLTSDTSITFTVGSHSIVLSASGIQIDGRVFLNHEHLPGNYVSDGFPVTGASGGVV